MDSIRNSAIGSTEGSSQGPPKNVDHGRFGAQVDEPRVTQVMHQPLGGSVTNPDSSFNNRESNDILTDKQKTAYS